MRSSLFSVATLTAATAAASAQEADCDYYYNDRCIKPQASVSASIPFSPLFKYPPTFVYAVDELSDEDLKALKKKNSLAIPSSYTGPVLKAAWWLQYDNNTVNRDRKQERRYYAFALETSSKAKVGGESNGCAGLLGAACIKNLKEVIALKTFGASPFTDGGLGTVLSSLYDRPLLNLSCPVDIFGTKNAAPNLDIPLLLNTMEPFATYSESFTRDPLPSGGPEFTHGIPQLRLRSLAEQEARGVVGITVSWPWSNSLGDASSYRLSDVTVETVCLRVGSAKGVTRRLRVLRDEE